MKEIIRKIRRKIANMIKTAILKSISEEDAHQILTMAYNGVEQEAVHYSPYGLYSKPPKGALAVVVSCGSRESSQAALVWNPKKRPEDLSPGESALWNQNGNCYVHVKNDGSVEVKNEKRKITLAADSLTYESLDGTPVGDIKYGGTGLLTQMQSFQGVGNLSLPVPLNPAATSVLSTMLTQTKLEITS